MSSNCYTLTPRLRVPLSNSNWEKIHNQTTQKTLTLKALLKINLAIQHNWAPSTLQSYQYSVSQFLRFCDREHIPRHMRTPTPKWLLLGFAADGLGKTSGHTARKKISALKAWHAVNNWTWRGTECLSYVLNGVQNMTPHTSLKPERPPVTLQALRILATYLNIRDPLDAAILACACTAFWGQCRLGELLPLTKTSPQNTRLPTRLSLKHTPNNRNTWVLHLPTTKTNHRGQKIVLIGQRGPTNPIQTLHNHLKISGISTKTPLFSYKSTHSFQILTKKLFMNRCNQIWRRFGYPKFTGHCFRIGGMTHLLTAGVPPDVVKTMGRWSSDAFLKYWRSVENIAPIHASNIPTTRHIRHTQSNPTRRHRQ